MSRTFKHINKGKLKATYIEWGKEIDKIHEEFNSTIRRIELPKTHPVAEAIERLEKSKYHHKYKCTCSYCVDPRGSHQDRKKEYQLDEMEMIKMYDDLDNVVKNDNRRIKLHRKVDVKSTRVKKESWWDKYQRERAEATFPQKFPGAEFNFISCFTPDGKVIIGDHTKRWDTDRYNAPVYITQSELKEQYPELYTCVHDFDEEEIGTQVCRKCGLIRR